MGDTLRWVLCIFPIYPVINGLLWSSTGITIIPFLREGSDFPIADNLWGIQNLGGDVAALICHFFIDSAILAIIELDLFSSWRGTTTRSIPPRDPTIRLDEDVIEEEIRVAATKTDVIRVNDFRKAYTTLLGKPFLAVERLSFGVDYGEVFCLLGVNGAGKSTTFKSLTAHTDPT